MLALSFLFFALCDSQALTHCDSSGAVTLRVVIPSQGQSQFNYISSAFTNQTGNQFVSYAIGPIPAMIAEMVSDLAGGTVLYDGYLAPFSPSIIKYIEQDELTDVTQLVRDSQVMTWSGVLTIFRDYNSVYNNKVYLIPVDGDMFIMHYRRDLQAADNWTVPTTWEEYAQIAERYNGVDLNGDNIPDFGTCVANDPFFGFYQFGALAASYIQTQGTSQGMWFGLSDDGLSTLFNSPAYAAALQMYNRLIALGPLSVNQTWDQTAAHNMWGAGRCAVYWSWPSAGTRSVGVPTPYIHGRMGSTVLPGSPQVLDRTTNTLVNCADQPSLCPYAQLNTQGVLVNHTPFLCCGFIAAINAGTDPAKQLALFDFFASFSYNVDVSQPTHPFNPFRRTPDQFAIGPFLAHGWDLTDATQYLQAISDSMNSENIAISLRVEWEPQFQTMIANRRISVQNNPTANYALVAAGLDQDVNTFLDQTGRLQVEAEYRKSLNLALRNTRTPYVLPRVATALPLFFAVLNGVAIMVMIIGVWRYKYSPVMRASTVSFMFIILVGGLLVVPSIVMTVLTPSEGSCTGEMWFHNVGFCIVFTGLFAKNWRIASIFNGGELKQVKIRVRELVLIVALFLSVDVLLLTLASTISMPTGTIVDNPGDVNTTIEKCDGSGLMVFQWLIFSYHIIILGWGSTLAWRVRNIALFQFNESKHMMFAVYNFTIASILLLPITQVAFSEPTSVMILSALLKTWAFLGSLLFLLVPKFYAIFLNTELPRLQIELTKTPKSNSKTDSEGWDNVPTEDIKNYSQSQSELIKTLKAKVREYEHVLIDTYEWTGMIWEDVKITKPRGLRPSMPADAHTSHGGAQSSADPQSSKLSQISDDGGESPNHSQSHPSSRPPATGGTPSHGSRTIASGGTGTASPKGGLHVRNASSTAASKTKNTTLTVAI